MNVDWSLFYWIPANENIKKSTKQNQTVCYNIKKKYLFVALLLLLYIIIKFCHRFISYKIDHCYY